VSEYCVWSAHGFQKTHLREQNYDNPQCRGRVVRRGLDINNGSDQCSILNSQFPSDKIARTCAIASPRLRLRNRELSIGQIFRGNS
jgi:hypothetical protein